LAIVPAPAHAASACSGVLVSLDGCLAGMPLTPASSQAPGETTNCAPAGTACATTRPPSTDQTTIVPKVSPAPPRHRATPPSRPAVRTGPAIVAPMRFHRADLDPSFTSGSFETTLPYDLPWYARRFDAPPPQPGGAPASTEPNVLSLLAPIRIAMMYIGLGLLAAAVGIRKILVAH
jgi:hypothetical protein